MGEITVEPFCYFKVYVLSSSKYNSQGALALQRDQCLLWDRLDPKDRGEKTHNTSHKE